MNTFTTLIAIFLAAILMFGFPLMTLADRNDDVTQLTVQVEVSNLVDEAVKTGLLTQDQYDSFLSTIAATGNAYDVEMQIQILDENPAKKTSQSGNSLVIGEENAYYIVYSTQIEERLAAEGKYVLKEGDIFSMTVKERGSTLSEVFRNVFYKVTGNEAYVIFASDAATCTTNGK